jgi:O-antigen ligase
VSVTSYKLEFANDFLKGLAGNKNITAASLVMKIPFVLLVYHQYKSRLVKFISLFILTIVIINLLFLGSRASFISLFLIFITYVLFILFKNRNELNLSFLLKHLHIPVILILSFLFFNSNVAQDDQGTIQNRVSSFVVEDLDESSLQRIRFYKQALKFSLENPLMGAGIGNWKVISVKLDKDYITSYIVPYVLHNDFLEVLGETNIIGLFFYVLFFISIFYIIKKNYFYNNNKSSDYKYVLVLLSLIAYLVDASLNFPLYRALMQISLLLTLLYVLKLHSMNKISKK